MAAHMREGVSACAEVRPTHARTRSAGTRTHTGYTRAHTRACTSTRAHLLDNAAIEVKRVVMEVRVGRQCYDVFKVRIYKEGLGPVGKAKGR